MVRRSGGGPSHQTVDSVTHMQGQLQIEIAGRWAAARSVVAVLGLAVTSIPPHPKDRAVTRALSGPQCPSFLFLVAPPLVKGQDRRLLRILSLIYSLV